MDFNKCFLSDVIGIIVVDYHFAGMPINALLILPDEQIEPIVSGFGISDLT
jgi:hypothetical protein